MKKIILPFIFLLFSSPVFAITYETLNIQMPYASRLGTGNTPEVRYEEVKAETKKNEVIVKTIDDTDKNLNFMDLNIKYLSDEIIDEMDSDSGKVLSDLSILYNSAIQRSETIRYAIYKLSNPEENKPDEGIIKKNHKTRCKFFIHSGNRNEQ